MSVNSKMTAIADLIRALLGLSGTMGLDAMATNLGTEQTNINNAFSAVNSKGGTAPSSKVSGNLATAINSIPTGVTVQRKSGTFTTNKSGVVTVNCGFQPDLVVIKGELYDDSDGIRAFNGAAAFAEETRASIQNIAMWATDCLVYDLYVVQNDTGFDVVQANFMDFDTATTTLANKTFDYVAVKYS